MTLIERLQWLAEKQPHFSEIKEAADRLEAAEKLIETLYWTLEEAMTYCEGPQWSPSMVDDCKSALAAAKRFREEV